MTSEPLIKSRLDKQRAMTSITLRIPADVVDSLKTVAIAKGFTGYHGLLKSYVSAGLRRDEAELAHVVPMPAADGLSGTLRGLVESQADLVSPSGEAWEADA